MERLIIRKLVSLKPKVEKQHNRGYLQGRVNMGEGSEKICPGLYELCINFQTIP
jgi:hypothetical protein